MFESSNKLCVIFELFTKLKSGPRGKRGNKILIRRTPNENVHKMLMVMPSMYGHEQASRTCLHEIMGGTTFFSQPLCSVHEGSTWVLKSWSKTSWYRMFTFSSHPPWIDTYTFVKVPRQFLVLSCYANTASTHLYITGYSITDGSYQ